MKNLKTLWKNYWVLHNKPWSKVNLCSGSNLLPGYCNIDISENADVVLDLETDFPSFKKNSIKTLVCISAINYFSHHRAEEIIKEIYQIMKPKGIVRFATQDLKVIMKKYVSDDRKFFFQKLANGSDRFEGATMADKVNSWFYGYKSHGKHCKYFYDYESLALLFEKAGFSKVNRKKYLESSIPEIKKIDNRQDQMFFLEAIK